MYCDASTDVHNTTHPHIDPHIDKSISNNSHINCGNDKKKQWLYNNQFGSYNSFIGITLNLP